jgi:hypothetical protein
MPAGSQPAPATIRPASAPQTADLCLSRHDASPPFQRREPPGHLGQRPTQWKQTASGVPAGVPLSRFARKIARPIPRRWRRTRRRNTASRIPVGAGFYGLAEALAVPQARHFRRLSRYIIKGRPLRDSEASGQAGCPATAGDSGSFYAIDRSVTSRHRGHRPGERPGREVPAVMRSSDPSKGSVDRCAGWGLGARCEGRHDWAP